MIILTVTLEGGGRYFKEVTLAWMFISKSDCIDESRALSVVGALLLAGVLVITTLPSIGGDGASGKKT